jgi:hypothetical protein
MLGRLKSFIPNNPLPAMGASIANKVAHTPYLGKTVSHIGHAASTISNAISYVGSVSNRGAKNYVATCDKIIGVIEKTANVVENTLDVMNAAASAAVTPIIHPINTVMWAHGMNNVQNAYNAFSLKNQKADIPGTEFIHIVKDKRSFNERLQDAIPHLYLGASKAALTSTLELGTMSNAFFSQPTYNLEPSRVETAFNIWHEYSREFAAYTWTKGAEIASEALPMIGETASTIVSGAYNKSIDFYNNTTKEAIFDGLTTGFSNTQTSLQIGGTILGTAGFLYLSARNFTKCAEAIETRSPVAFVKHGTLSLAGLTAAVATPFLLGAHK